MTDPTPTRDEAPDVLAKPITAAASDMCEIARIAGEWRNGPKQSLTAIREIRAVLASAPAPASGGVDAVWKALDTANHVFHFDLRHMIEWGDDYNQAVKDASDRVAAALASLSPAATPVSEAGGETVGLVAKLRVGALHRDVPAWISRVMVEASEALAKPASSPAGVREASLSRSDVCRLWQYAAIERPSMTVEGFPHLLLHELDDRADSLSQSTSAGRVGE